MLFLRAGFSGWDAGDVEYDQWARSLLTWPSDHAVFGILSYHLNQLVTLSIQLVCSSKMLESFIPTLCRNPKDNCY